MFRAQPLLPITSEVGRPQIGRRRWGTHPTPSELTRGLGMRSNDPRHSRWHRLLHLIALTLSLSMILSSFGLAPAAFAQLAPNGSTGSPSPSPTGSTGTASNPTPSGSTGGTVPSSPSPQVPPALRRAIRARSRRRTRPSRRGRSRRTIARTGSSRSSTVSQRKVASTPGA